jgi:hypothetical protein
MSPLAIQVRPAADISVCRHCQPYICCHLRNDFAKQSDVVWIGRHASSLICSNISLMSVRNKKDRPKAHGFAVGGQNSNLDISAGHRGSTRQILAERSFEVAKSNCKNLRECEPCRGKRSLLSN